MPSIYSRVQYNAIRDQSTPCIVILVDCMYWGVIQAICGDNDLWEPFNEFSVVLKKQVKLFKTIFGDCSYRCIA
jgi:hypothetical protein